ncbi:MAG: two-component regulator propeller domain-containing protein, partial [Bacteroidota bacterium]
MKNLQFGYLLVCLVTFLCVEYSSAQNLVYKNYSIKDGLASTVVYYVAQDNKGFVWFGTDQGLCRFDGTNFKTFTTQDGLPDNEVLFIRVDSQDRVWMICYNSRPCFIYNGVIHTTHNDSMLSRIGGADNLFRDIGIDKEGKVWILGS